MEENENHKLFEKLKKDEEQDILLMKEALEKDDNMIRLASDLSAKFKGKYGPEFGGVLNVEYDFVNKLFKLTCGRDYSFDIDEDDVEDLPIRIRCFREQAIEDKKKPRPSILKPKDKKPMQQLRTEDGEEIKVEIEETHDAEVTIEKELDDDDGFKIRIEDD